MIPIAHVWYTKPPLPKTNFQTESLYDAYYAYNYYGTNNDWNQGILTILNNYCYESRERNFYNNELNEFLKKDKEYGPDMILVCHTKRKDMIEKLEYFQYGHISLRYGLITVKFDDKIELNKLKFYNGIYENEIILIDEHCPK